MNLNYCNQAEEVELRYCAFIRQVAARFIAVFNAPSAPRVNLYRVMATVNIALFSSGAIKSSKS